MSLRTLSALALVAVTAVTLSGCVANSTAPVGTPGALTVNSTATECAVSAATVPSGPVSFAVSNTADAVTEFYLMGSDGLSIVGELENIGPGITRTLTIQAKPGTYYTVCKPNMVGNGVAKTPFTVTDSGTAVVAGNDEVQMDAAAANYLAYVKDQSGRLLTATAAFAAAFTAGDVAGAKALYAPSRANYERIEPVAASFGDLDPRLDLRESDLAEGDTWAGWHRMEKDLWQPTAARNGGLEYVPLTAAERAALSTQLNADTQKLFDLVHASTFSFTLDTVSNGAISLLDEVATSKITGEEEIWSHTDLWDFQANLEGARVAFEGVRDIAASKDAALVTAIDSRFTALEAQLAAYGSLDAGFSYYSALSPAQVKALGDSVNALSEPLSKLTAALVS